MAAFAEDFIPAIGVPVRNEVERLPKLLFALARQSWIRSENRPLPVVLVMNNCSDLSAEITRTIGSGLPGLELTVVEVEFSAADAHVGSARRLAMDMALEMIGPECHGAILTTDADATPQDDWVEANITTLAKGVDAVGGSCQPKPMS